MKRHTLPDGRTHWVPDDYVEPEPAKAGPLTTKTAGAIVEGEADKPAPKKRGPGRPRKT
ncbi:MAG: hypothetical protein KJO07_24010 [Deltaproteobacteria bacterium]|nr:hypothetical protein [Deltaproteobacteria bacterium]